jgi:hypothetical protein
MFRPSILAIFVVAAALPALALAAPVTTPVRVAGTFENVESRGDFDVQVREGSPASVEIVAEPGMAESILVEVSGGALRLSRVTNFDSTKGVVVKVVLPEFRGLSVGGSGKGSAESGPAPRDVNLAVSGSGHLTWKGSAAALSLAVSGSGDLHSEGPSSRLSAALSGSGDLSSRGDTGEASVQVSGSGDARLSGKGDGLKVAVSGSGSVDAKAFAAKDASVSIAGSGDVSLRLAGGTLTARVVGSGNVTWTGEGKLGDVEVTGSGRFRKR